MDSSASEPVNMDQNVLYDPFDTVEPENVRAQPPLPLSLDDHVKVMAGGKIWPPLPEDDPIKATPNTDNLLNILPAKITVLGKEQAKKRLLAFSSLKQTATLTTLPVLKKLVKPKVVVEVPEEKYDENGTKLEDKVVIKKPAKKGK